ncbi:MAG TPA: aldehyde dehydrogenase family protein, partial [Candidatus Binatia bacterium]|nr:aldehyde dehydrogenase family protein [Candidatus Binatia bacterium]
MSLALLVYTLRPMPPERRLFIDGKLRETGRTMPVVSPYDGREVARVHLGGENDMEDATQAAQRGFKAMATLSRGERAGILRRVAEGVRKRGDEIASTMTAEMGKPIQYSRAEVARCVTTFTLAAEEAGRFGGEIVPVDIEAHTTGYFAMTIMVPIGPIAAISPFNFPLNLVAHKLAPCLAVGSSMVLKPARQTPLEALTLAEIVHEAGAPAGAFNVVNCEPAVGERLATDDRFPYLTFTGSVGVGWRLKQKAWKKRVTLELGGNAACLVHSDADLDYAVSRCLAGGFGQTGQSCISVQRILVHEPVYAAFEKKFLDGVARLKTGDPTDPATVVGPVIDKASAERIQSWIAEARGAGARVLAGGTREGNVIAPTVIADAGRDLKVSCQEVFGPVVTLGTYREFEQAVAAADDSSYGLQAGVFTHDIRLIRHAVANLHVGGVMVNEVPTMRVDNMPYGGTRDSGLG